MKDNPWNKRDDELDLRKRLAGIIAEIGTGAADANPTSWDYDLADALRELIGKELRSTY